MEANPGGRAEGESKSPPTVVGHVTTSR